MTKIYYSAAAPGAGKTHYALQKMATVTGKYLYAVDRREMIDGRTQEGVFVGGSRTKALQDIATNAGKSPIIASAQTPRSCDNVDKLFSVRSVVERAPVAYQEHDHIILVITHEAMKSANLDSFIGWELIIDEAPIVFEAQTASTPAAADFFEKQYNLERLCQDRSIVTLRHDAITYGNLRKDDFLSGLSNFHRRVGGKYSVVVDVESWDRLRGDRKLTWWTLWLPDELSAFCKITVLANAFDRSVAAKMWQAIMPDLELVPVPIMSNRVFKPREMHVYHFAQSHRGGSYFFKSVVGSDCLDKVNEWMVANAPPRDIIWTCNKSVGEHFDIRGKFLTPKQAGSNSYQGYSAAAMFYTAKVSPVEMPILECLGIDASDIEISRELEDIYQFVCRIAVRDPDSTVPLQVFVYDAHQAQYLCDTFNSLGYVSASMALIEVGISDIVRPSTGRKAVHSSESPAERRARKSAAKKRHRDVKRKLAIEAGTYVKPGRPRLVPSLQ